ncbi:hypothetical protein OIV83_001699 [Microbotryomycetes sp. JL201]|nr:hypothetical protein OIV83_001699 [Microbotryomycetes sp. JL201]
MSTPHEHSYQVHHPQQLVNRLSLVSNPLQSTSVHGPSDEIKKSAAASPVGHADAQAWWLHASRLIDWDQAPTVAYGLAKGSKKPSWFPDGRLNTCYNCVDRHVLAGYGHRPAFHHVPTMPQSTGQRTTVTYQELLDDVKVLAGVLKHSFGVKKGDRVVIYMPMIKQTAVAMLACARIGAIHSVVFGGFAPKELAKRIEDATPVLVMAASCGLEPKAIIDYKKFVNEAIEKHSKHKAPLLMYQRQDIKGYTPAKLDKSRQEFDWSEEIATIRKAGKQVESCEMVESNHPLYILYTSGTTGNPKGVVRDHAGHAVSSRYSMENTFGLSRNDTMLCASDFGWVVGHSYIVYCPLLLGCASVIFEGKPTIPDAGVFWKMVQDYKVNCLFTAPTALRAVRREDPDAKLMAKYNLKTLRSLFLAGERSEPGIISHYQRLLDKMAAHGALVNDNYWSTESGSPITAIQITRHFPALAQRPGSAGMPLPGMDLRIVDDEGRPVKRGEMGNIVLARPLPPSALMTVWNNDARFQSAYFERFQGKGDHFDTGDAGVMDEQGYVSVLSRADDIINVAGHRLGTSLLEQVVSAHPAVAECCVVGLPDELKGHVPFALITRATSAEAQHADLTALLKNVNEHVRTDVGAIAALGGLTVTKLLPKTRSGKVLRRTVKELVENASQGKLDAPVGYPPTIEDASTVEEARKVVNAWFKQRQATKSKL